jgi:type IV pilus assembly protein PilQ
MRRLIKELDVPVPQVLIDSKIVIASENFSRTVGASWKFQVTNERGTAGPIGAFNGQDSSLSGGGDAEVTQTAFAVSAGAGSSAFGWGFGSTGQAFLKTALALSEINGESKTVASPRVIVNNNQTAKITDGQTLSQIVQGGSGGSGQSKELKPVLQLSVKPQVTSHGSIQLKDLSVQKDSVTSFGATTASLDNKQLTTDVLVDSGSTLGLGGIYQMNSLTGEQGIPLLKDLPFIGQLFRVNTAQSSKSELMVFITPQVLDPEGGSQSL